MAMKKVVSREFSIDNDYYVTETRTYSDGSTREFTSTIEEEEGSGYYNEMDDDPNFSHLSDD